MLENCDPSDASVTANVLRNVSAGRELDVYDGDVLSADTVGLAPAINS